jgi:hypothetical protein
VLTFGTCFGYLVEVMASETILPIYQLHVWIRRISPMIWRRLLVRSDSTLAQLHDILQIAFGWTDAHLHRFRIHGRDYGLSRVGGPTFFSRHTRSGSTASGSAPTSGSSRRGRPNRGMTTCAFKPASGSVDRWFGLRQE